MKKILLFAVSLLFVLASCKKTSEDNPIPVNTISATVDGVNISHNTNISAKFSSNSIGGPSYTLNIQAATPNKAFGISLTSPDKNAIAKGTYTLASSKNNTPIWVYVDYEDYEPNTNIPDQPYITDPNGIQPTTVTITSISSTNVQGTFSGTLVYSQGGSGTKTVTNGKFNVNISN
jgi:hypothetical protein